jgi:hypothetical protein
MNNRQQSELHRLYQPAQAAVLALGRPADWQALVKVWRGVQADLDLPAPAIAVNGVDGFQLWFSLPAPVEPAQALAFLDALRSRYLGDIAPARVGMTVAAGAVAAAPPLLMQDEQWSAFIAADLAALFADEPWIDTPPSPDGQADLLARLASIKVAEFQAALARLGIAARPGDPPSAAKAVPARTRQQPGGADIEPRRFLQDVLNDDTVALALRIEAAKALLA